jgi:HK97 family phage prohead protease
MDSLETRIAAAKREIRATSVDGVIRRAVPFSVEARAGEGGGYVIDGHAAVFNELSDNLGGFREKIDPGAFAKVLADGPDVRALFNHDPNFVLASTASTTAPLALEEDKRGLAYEATVPADIADSYYGKAMRAQLDTGLVTQSSFAFRVGDDSWEEDEDTGGLIRTIHEFSGLYDVSPVTYPAYPQTDAGTSSHEDGEITSPPDAERTASADEQEQGQMAASDESSGEEMRLHAARARLRERL